MCELRAVLRWTPYGTGAWWDAPKKVPQVEFLSFLDAPKFSHA